MDSMSKHIPAPFYHEQVSAQIRAVQVIGLTATAILAGKTFGSSFSTTPALLLAPAPLLAKQWKKQFDVDHAIVPGLAATSTAILGFLAYRSPGSSSARSLYTLATALVAATIPYSAIFILPLTQKLVQKARLLASASLTDAEAEAGVAKEETVHLLVDRWATLNLGRSMLVGLSALVATWAAVDRTEVVEIGLGLATGAERIR